MVRPLYMIQEVGGGEAPPMAEEDLTPGPVVMSETRWEEKPGGEPAKEVRAEVDASKERRLWLDPHPVGPLEPLQSPFWKNSANPALWVCFYSAASVECWWVFSPESARPFSKLGFGSDLVNLRWRTIRMRSGPTAPTPPRLASVSRLGRR